MSKRSRSNDDHTTSRRRTDSYSPPTSLSINQRNLFEQRKRTKAHAFAEQDTSRKMMDSQRRVRESKRKYSVQLYTMKLEQLELVYRNMMECNRLLGVIRETIPDAAFKKTVFNMRRWIESEILNFIVEFRNSGFYKKLTIDLIVLDPPKSMSALTIGNGSHKIDWCPRYVRGHPFKVSTQYNFQRFETSCRGSTHS